MLIENNIIKIMDIIYTFLIWIMIPPSIDIALNTCNKAIHKSGTRTIYVVYNVDHLLLSYSPDKEPLYRKLIEKYKNMLPKEFLPVKTMWQEMTDIPDGAVAEYFFAISPDSLKWLARLERVWQEQHPGSLQLTGYKIRYVLSPIVIALWESTARQMGYPGKKSDWKEPMNRSLEDTGSTWYHPATTAASGLLSITMEFYTGMKKIVPLDYHSAVKLQLKNLVSVPVLLQQHVLPIRLLLHL